MSFAYTARCSCSELFKLFVLLSDRWQVDLLPHQQFYLAVLEQYIIVEVE